jgi:5'-3' exonuclease
VDVLADMKRARELSREASPDELVPQFPLIRDAVRAFGLTPIEQAGYEADDLIATYARQAAEARRSPWSRATRISCSS